MTNLGGRLGGSEDVHKPFPGHHYATDRNILMVLGRTI